jgi:hypothetical protein
MFLCIKKNITIYMSTSIFKNRPKNFLKLNTHHLSLEELENIVFSKYSSISLICSKCKKHTNNGWNKYFKFLKTYSISFNTFHFCCDTCLKNGYDNDSEGEEYSGDIDDF